MTDIQLALVVIGLGLGLLALAAYMRRVLGPVIIAYDEQDAIEKAEALR